MSRRLAVLTLCAVDVHPFHLRHHPFFLSAQLAFREYLMIQHQVWPGEQRLVYFLLGMVKLKRLFSELAGMSSGGGSGDRQQDGGEEDHAGRTSSTAPASML